MIIEKPDNQKEFIINCNNDEIQTIYQGLYFIYNHEKDKNLRSVIKKQVQQIEKVIPQIEF